MLHTLVECTDEIISQNRSFWVSLNGLIFYSLVSLGATSDCLTYVCANDHANCVKKKIGPDCSQQADEDLSDQWARNATSSHHQVKQTEKFLLQHSKGK